MQVINHINLKETELSYVQSLTIPRIVNHFRKVTSTKAMPLMALELLIPHTLLSGTQ